VGQYKRHSPAQGIRIPILQEIYRTVGLLIDEQSGIGVAATQRQVVNTENARRGGVWQRQATDQPEQCVRAGGASSTAIP
jgi:hypothetical protein